jgi:circadian clock protein KaiB
MDSKRASVTGQFENLFEKAKRQRYVLCLFITGMTSRSAASVARIKSVCEEYLPGRYDLEIIDIYQQPELAREHQIFAAPTLVKLLPAPTRRLIGDFSDVERVLRGLDLSTTRCSTAALPTALTKGSSHGEC